MTQSKISPDTQSKYKKCEKHKVLILQQFIAPCYSVDTICPSEKSGTRVQQAEAPLHDRRRRAARIGDGRGDGHDIAAQSADEDERGADHILREKRGGDEGFKARGGENYGRRCKRKSIEWQRMSIERMIRRENQGEPTKLSGGGETLICRIALATPNHL
jgi:hypothetical protein